ncbi:hypothetical protein HK096_008367 [Nowakowskiella sp. JEL0078]|nr:hypothetical protein HK096_008367 [Nowakowskiella sp. JEL0078]
MPSNAVKPAKFKDYSNLTQIYFRINDNSAPEIGWIDYANDTKGFQQNYNPVTGDLVGNRSIVPSFGFFGTLLFPPNYGATLAFSNPNCLSPLGQWDELNHFGSTYFVYSVCAKDKYGTFGGNPPLVCLGTLLVETKLFSRLAPTKNSMILLLGKYNKLLATNWNVSVSNAQNTDLVNVTNISDPLTREIATKILNDANGNFSNISPVPQSSWNFQNANNYFETQQYSVAADNGNQWITSYIPISFGTTEIFVLVMSFPRSDIFGQIDSSIKTGVTSASIISAAGAIICILLTLAVTIPLRQVTKNMKQVTKFDFSVLEKGYFSENSFFSEIRQMEMAFNTMVKAL